MENPAAFWGALFFIVLIAGANFMMYAIVRGVTRSGNKNFLETLSHTLNPNSRKKDESMHTAPDDGGQVERFGVGVAAVVLPRFEHGFQFRRERRHSLNFQLPI